MISKISFKYVNYNASGRYNVVDDDECLESSHDCDVNAVCSNTEGSFACGCKAGYTGSGTICTSNCLHL